MLTMMADPRPNDGSGAPRREDRSRIGPARGQVQQVLTSVGVDTDAGKEK